jgi:quinol monooxygenase YgiN|tara:strand:- start:7717 stop:7974 length:258 start_codon:yes stop_codon:yes gene_type:complete
MATDPTNPPLLSSFSAHVTLTIAPANIPAFLVALKPAYDAVIAEPENVFFQILQHPQKPGVFRFIETWNMSVEKFMTVRLFIFQG